MSALEQAGHTCRLACRAGSRIALEAGRRGLRWEPVRFRNSFHLPSLLAIRRMLRDCDAGICHSGHDADTLAIAARLGFQPRAGLLRVRTYLAGSPRPWTVNHLVDHTLTPSRFLREKILGFPGIHTDKVSVLNPIVPSVALRQQAGEPLPSALAAWMATRQPLVAHAAMLRSEKGHELALRTIARLVPRFPSLGYVMAGAGKKEKALRAQAAKLGIENHIYFAGLLMPVAPLLAAADLVIMPSRSEPLGLAQLEALTLGVPVAVSNAGGLPETVEDGVSGWVIPSGDEDAWVAGVGEALANPEEAGRRARVGRTRVENEFSPEAHLESLVGFLPKRR